MENLTAKQAREGILNETGTGENTPNHRLNDSDQTKQTKQTKQGVPLHISPDDLKLSDELKDNFPPVLKDYLNYSSPLSDVPDEFLITPFLAMTAATIGRARYIKMGGITIYPTVWTVLFAGSSTMRKSTALSFAKKPFKLLEKTFEQNYQREMETWQRLKKQAKEQGEDFNKPEPIRKTIYNADGFSDLTFWQALRDQGSVISMPGEFTALWAELTRPRNSLKDIALQIFDAEDKIRRNTRMGGDITLNNPVWCIAGATTLSSFQRSLTRTQRSSGLLQRIIPICMEQPTKEFKALTELPEPDKELYNSMNRDVKELHDLEEREVNMARAAKDMFTEWSHDLHNRATEMNKHISDIGGYESRLSVYVLKFALIFQQLDDHDHYITEKNMEAAIALAEWVFNHIIYMLDKNYIFNKYYADRLKIREIIKKQDSGKISRTQLMNLSHFDKEQLDRAVNSEIEAGKVKEYKLDTGGVRPKIEYEITSNE